MRVPLVASAAVALALMSCTSAEITSTTGPSVASTTPLASTTTTAATSTTVPTTTTTTTADRDDQLLGLISDWASDNDPVGVAAAALFPDGHLWLGAAGLADREAGAPIVPSDRFEVASITKTFMAALTLRIAEDGLIDLDEPISGYLPSFPEADAITVRALLSHTAGVHDPTPQLVTDRNGPPDPNRVFSSDELIAAAAEGSPAFPPGSMFEYSNANYWVLAAVLEQATGRGVASLLDDYLIEPLELGDTRLFDSSLPEVQVVNAYKDLDLDGVEDAMGTKPLPGLVTPAWTAGGMISSVTDLVTFVDGLFAGEVITADSLDQMLTTGGDSYGLGIYRAGGYWGHDGGIAGYLSAVFHNPSTGVTVAVLTNRFGPDAPQADALALRLAPLADQLAG